MLLLSLHLPIPLLHLLEKQTQKPFWSCSADTIIFIDNSCLQVWISTNLKLNYDTCDYQMDSVENELSPSPLPFPKPNTKFSKLSNFENILWNFHSLNMCCRSCTSVEELDVNLEDTGSIPVRCILFPLTIFFQISFLSTLKNVVIFLWIHIHQKEKIRIFWGCNQDLNRRQWCLNTV